MFLPIDGMRMPGRHDDALPFAQQVFLPVDGNFAHAVQTGDHGVSAGCMGADFLTLPEGKEGDAQGIILRQRFADDLPLLIGTTAISFGVFALLYAVVFRVTSNAYYNIVS